MKKFIFIMPLMAVSLLASCNNGGGDTPGPSPVGTTYTITFDCKNCTALDENKKEITSVKITISKPYTTYNKFYLEGKGLYKKPLGSLIKVEKTNKNEEVDFDYDPLTGEIEIPIIDNLTITASGINKTLEECSWAEINEISTTGRAKEFFEVYDPERPELNCKKVYLKGQGFPHMVRIIGFDHDYSELPDEGDPYPNKALGITFEFANVISDSKRSPLVVKWNEKDDTSSTNYDYRKSTLNDFLNDTGDDSSVINMLPSDPVNKDLREVIKLVDKKVGVHGDSGFTPTSFDGSEDYPYPYLFPLAHDEMADHHEFVADAEGSKYQYYVEHPNQGDRIKKVIGASGDAGVYYWIRSPYITTVDAAWYIEDYGSFANYGSVDHNPFYVAPAFCI